MANAIEFEPWQQLVVSATLESKKREDREACQAIGLPGKSSFLSYRIEKAEPEGSEHSLVIGEIGMYGGYTYEQTRLEMDDMLRVASIWSVTTPDEAKAVVRDLDKTENIDDPKLLRKLKSVLAQWSEERDIVIVASRDIQSRQASSLFVFRRYSQILGPRYVYGIIPLLAIGDEQSHSWAAAKAAFGMQVRNDYECLIKGMASADVYKPLHTTLHNLVTGNSKLVTELPDIIDMSQDMCLEGDKACDFIDFDKVKTKRASCDREYYQRHEYGAALHDDNYGEVARKIRGTIDRSIKLGF